MPTIFLETSISAPIDVCFNLSRSIDLHIISTSETKEKAIAGRMSGLIEMGETVTWQANHFCIRQKLTSKITAMDYPNSFCDEMVQGAFKSFKHDHLFKETNGKTTMIDIFKFASPLGLLGKIADLILLKSYLTSLLKQRNLVIKQFAESDNWKKIV